MGSILSGGRRSNNSNSSTSSSGLNEIRVLCLGDSLTAGTIDYQLKMPYSTCLSNLLQARGHSNIAFLNAGVNGDTVPRMQARLETLLRKDSFQYLILLGGTNDLGFINTDDLSVSPEDIAASISFEGIYDLLMKAPHVKAFLHLTVPYVVYDRLDPRFKDVKDALNRRILLADCPKKRTLDINSSHLQFNHLLLSEATRERYWQDSLHYTATGYQRMAESIYDDVISMIQEQRQE
ncbi:hypothetical protein EC968_000938 [Mortierella alpina]|nr:hypothetical protein EC968_000938 [Mortierella alpina]